MIFTLHRYIFRELLKVFALTTFALTMMLSTGLMLRPIQEYGVAPGQILHLMGYFLPITLTFVLPMSALFAGAMVYGRFASDRELDACRASGISIFTLVYPGLFLAICVSVATLLLSFYVAPNFVHRAERAVKANAKQILFRNLQRKGYYDIDGDHTKYVVYADRVDMDQDILEGVIIIQSKRDRIPEFITTERAKLQIDAHSKYNDISIAARNVRRIDDTGDAQSEYFSVSARIPSLLEDDIKFQTIDRIKEIRRDPLEFHPIRQQALNARAQLAIELLARDLKRQMTHGQDYYELVADDRVLLISTEDCAPVDSDMNKHGWTIDLTGPVRVLELSPDRTRLICQWDCQQGRILLDDNDPSSKLELVLTAPTWNRNGVEGIAGQHVVRNIGLPAAIASAVAEDRLLAHLLPADWINEQLAQPTSILNRMRQEIKKKIKRTYDEIQAETHSKLILGLGCTTLILTGIALGIRLRGGHLLSAFGASSIPAGALIVCIMAGKDLAKNPSTPTQTGILVMWIGLAVLTLVMIGLYRKLLKT